MKKILTVALALALPVDRHFRRVRAGGGHAVALDGPPQPFAQALERAHAPCAYLGTIGIGRVGQLGPATHTTPDPVSLQRLLAQFAAGGALELVNDHDPKPLRNVFQAQYPGKFAWEYLEQGPDTWRVAISKLGDPHSNGQCCGSCGGQ